MHSDRCCSDCYEYIRKGFEEIIDLGVDDQVG